MDAKNDCLELKKKLRKEIKNRLATITPLIPEYSSRICKLIIKSELYKSSETLLAYMALPDEVDLQALINQAVLDGKNVYVPKVIPGTSDMAFYPYSDSAAFCKGAFGIMEPASGDGMYDLNEAGKKIKKTLVMVPGRAFSNDGSRLGRGKAFYDSFLSKAREKLCGNVFFCGVGFSVQFLDALPLESHDIKMDILVNENRLFAAK